MRILHVISDVSSYGPAAQLAMLGRAGIDARACVLGPDGPGVDLLREAGFAVDALGCRRLFPFAAWWRLHHVLHTYRPDVIHAWDNPSLRAATMAGGRALARIFASPALLTKGWSPRQLFDRWLLQGCHRIVTTHRTGRAEFLAQGCTPEQIALVPMAIDTAKRAVSG